MRSDKESLWSPRGSTLQGQLLTLGCLGVLVGFAWGCSSRPCLQWKSVSTKVTYGQPINRPYYLTDIECTEYAKEGDEAVQHPGWKPSSTAQCREDHLVSSRHMQTDYGYKAYRKNACKDDGRCTYEDGSCRVKSDAECRNSGGCSGSGRCHLMDGKCVPHSQDDCANSEQCRDTGLCGFIASTTRFVTRPACKAVKLEHCQRSAYCESLGNCAPFGGRCIKTAEAAKKMARFTARRKRAAAEKRKREERDRNWVVPVRMLDMHKMSCPEADEPVDFPSCRLAGEWLIPELATPKSRLMKKDRALGEKFLMRSCMAFPEVETYLRYGLENCELWIKYLKMRNDPRLSQALEKRARLREKNLRR